MKIKFRYKFTRFKVAQNNFQHFNFDGSLQYIHSLSLDATIMVSKNCPIIGEHVVITFVSQYVTIATVWPAKNTLNYSFRGF